MPTKRAGDRAGQRIWLALGIWPATSSRTPTGGGDAGRHGVRIKGLLDRAMILDRDARGDGRPLACHDGELRPLHGDLMDALEAGERGHTQDLATLCCNVLDLWPRCGTSPSTPMSTRRTTASERAIRHVLWRRTSTGTQTPDGDRFVERILVIRETCRCQDRPATLYLVDVHNARLTGTTDPDADHRITPELPGT